jgi:hypothetical protein
MKHLTQKLIPTNSLHAALIAPFVLLIVLAVGSTGYTSCCSGQQAVNDITTTLRNEIIARVKQNLVNYLDTPYKLDRSAQSMIELGILDAQNHESWLPYLWKQSQLYGTAINFALGKEQRHYVDPTLQIAGGIPLYDQSAAFVGVITTALRLSWAGDFLEDLKIGKSGQTFIIERTGMLVATSTGEVYFREVNGKQKRFNATESRNSVAQTTARYLTTHYSDLNLIKEMTQPDFEIGGKRQFLQVSPYTGEYGLDWLIVVVVPEADFMEQTQANNRITFVAVQRLKELRDRTRIINLSRWPDFYDLFLTNLYLQPMGEA